MEVKTINNIQLLLRSYCQQKAIIIMFAKLVLSVGQRDYQSEEQGFVLFKAS